MHRPRDRSYYDANAATDARRAAGTAIAGPAVELGGTASGFAVAGAGGAAALLVLLATGKVLAVPGRTHGVAARFENDRNGAAEPGLRSGHKA